MRKTLLPALLATGLVLTFAVGLGAGAAELDDAAPPAAPAVLEEPVASSAPAAGLCLDATGWALQASPPTCEECQDDCGARLSQCTGSCSSRSCIDRCIDKYSACLAKCPC